MLPTRIPDRQRIGSCRRQRPAPPSPWQTPPARERRKDELARFRVQAASSRAFRCASSGTWPSCHDFSSKRSFPPRTKSACWRWSPNALSRWRVVRLRRRDRLFSDQPQQRRAVAPGLDEPVGGDLSGGVRVPTGSSGFITTTCSIRSRWWTAQDPVGKRRIIHDAFFAIGQYRYVDWAVTTPLLLLKMVLSLKVKPREISGWIALLLGADFWMVLAGSIGDQQFSPRTARCSSGGTCSGARSRRWATS